MKTYGLIRARCPYFEKEAKYTVTCEGLYEGHSFVMKFETEEEKDDFMQVQCHCFPNKCPLAELITNEYYKTER